MRGSAEQKYLSGGLTVKGALVLKVLAYFFGVRGIFVDLLSALHVRGSLKLAVDAA